MNFSKDVSEMTQEQRVWDVEQTKSRVYEKPAKGQKVRAMSHEVGWKQSL